MFRTYIETTETNRTVSKQTETTLNFLKNTKICSLSNCFGRSSVYFSSIETQYFGIEAKQPKQSISKHTKQTGKALNFLKKYQNMLLIKLFRWSLFVLVQSKHQNSLFRFNRNYLFRYRSETTETIAFFGSGFSCFGSKLISKDTLPLFKSRIDQTCASKLINNK